MKFMRYGVAQIGLFMLIIGTVLVIYGNQELSLDEPDLFPGRNTEDNSGYVAIIILGGILAFFGFITLIYGLITEEEKQPQSQNKYCYNCKRQIPIDSNLCPYCGDKVTNSPND